MTTEELGKYIYAAYVKAAGGKAFNGADIPSWSDIGDDRRRCWIEAAREVKELFKP